MIPRRIADEKLAVALGYSFALLQEGSAPVPLLTRLDTGDIE